MSFRLPKILSGPAEWTLATAKRMLGVDIRMFARNAGIVSASYSISILRGIITGYLVPRLFPRALFGEYQFLQSIFGSITVLSLPGIDKSLPRAIARGEGGATRAIFRWHFLICLSGSVALLGGILLLHSFGRPHLWVALLLGAILFPISQTASSLMAALVGGQGKFAIGFKANLVWSTMMVIATFCILVFEPSALLLFVASVALPALTYLWFSKGLIPAEDSSIPTAPIKRFAWQMTFASLPVYLSTYVDKLLISGFFGLNQLAVFSVGIAIPEQVKTFAKELLPVSLASQARGEDSQKRRHSLLKVVGKATLWSLIPVTIFVLCTPFAFRILFPNYPEAIFLCQVAGALLFLQPSALLTQYMEAQAMVRELRWTQWVSAIVYIVALLLLMPILGLAGAVIGRGVLRLSYALCGIWFLWCPPRSA